MHFHVEKTLTGVPDPDGTQITKNRLSQIQRIQQNSTLVKQKAK